MADKVENPLDTESHLGLIRAALHPDERKFFQEYLGQDGPDVMDYVLPQGRFSKARELREDIVRSVIHNFIPSSTNSQATLGQARSIDPKFPAPPNAQSYSTAEGPGAPVATGVTPGQGFTQDQLVTPTSHGTMQDSLNRQYQQRGSPYYTEGPQPTTPAPTEDMNAILPRSHQNLLNSKIHMQGLRPIQRSATTAREDMRSLYEDLRNGVATEEYPGQTGHLAIALGYSQKAPDASTAQGRLAESKAQLAEQQNQGYKANQDSMIAQRESAARANDAKAYDLNAGFKTRQDELESRIIRNKATANSSNELMGVAKERQQLQEARLLLAQKKYEEAKRGGSQEDQDYWSNEILDLIGAHFKYQAGEPGFLSQMTGGILGGNSASHLVPKGQPPTGNPMQFQPGDIVPQEQGSLQAPEAITNIQPQAPAQDTRAQAKALYDRMKEGEVQTLNGTKYRRKGTKLEPVK